MRRCRALVGLPVLAPQDQRRLGQIDEVLLDHEHGRTLGMLVNGGGWFQPLGWLRTGAAAGDPAVSEHQVVAATDLIHPLTAADGVQLKRLRQQHEAWMQQPVVDAAGHHLGYLDDVVIAEDGWIILGYQLGRGWLDDWLDGKRILPYARAIGSTDDHLIVADPCMKE